MAGDGRAAAPQPISGPRVRNAPIPPEAVVVVRGDALDPHLSRHQAELFLRRYPSWGRYGLSAFYAATEADVDDLAAGQLERFPILLALSVRKLEESDFELVPTFRTPHVTIAFTGDLTARLDQLDALGTDQRPNPYHEPEPRAAGDTAP